MRGELLVIIDCTSASLLFFPLLLKYIALN